MKKYIRIREDNMGRTIEAWALIPEPKPLLNDNAQSQSEDTVFPMFLMITSMMFWGILGIYLGNLLFN